jgi:hypothetical protein
MKAMDPVFDQHSAARGEEGAGVCSSVYLQKELLKGESPEGVFIYHNRSNLHFLCMGSAHHHSARAYTGVASNCHTERRKSERVREDIK